MEEERLHDPSNGRVSGKRVSFISVTPGSQQHSNGWSHSQSIKAAQTGINELLNKKKWKKRVYKDLEGPEKGRSCKEMSWK